MITVSDISKGTHGSKSDGRDVVSVIRNRNHKLRLFVEVTIHAMILYGGRALIWRHESIKNQSSRSDNPHEYLHSNILTIISRSRDLADDLKIEPYTARIEEEKENTNKPYVPSTDPTDFQPSQ
jgi:hypothetical protein